jgi:ABC-type lipoprotein release transport system permease subunit
MIQRVNTTNKKMDNNMTAIVSTLMIILGFVNGMVVMSILDALHYEKLKSILNKAIDRKFESDQLIDDLQKQIADEKQEKDSLLEQLRGIVQTYQRIVPPQGPLERSNIVYDDSDDDEDEEFSNPASPDVQPNSMG